MMCRCVIVMEHLTRHVILNFHPLEGVLATAIHNFKWVKGTHICLIWEETFANIYV